MFARSPNFEALYVNAQNIATGAEFIGLNVVHGSYNPDCATCLVQYTKGNAANQLTITIEFGSLALAIGPFPSTTSPVTITASAALALAIPSGCRLFRLRFASQGQPATTDTISVVLQGLYPGFSFQ